MNSEKENLVLKKHFEFCKKWPCATFGQIYLQQIIDEINLNKDTLNENQINQFENIKKELENLQVKAKTVEKPVKTNELKIKVYENTEINKVYGISKVYTVKLIKNKLNTEFLETLPKEIYWTINDDHYFTWIDKNTEINIKSKYSIYLPSKYTELKIEEISIVECEIKKEKDYSKKIFNFFEKLKSKFSKFLSKIKK